MRFDGVELCCPRCRGDLREDGTRTRELVCAACDVRYPVLAGIPDLRVFADPYIDIDADRAKGLHLAEHLAGLDLEGALRYYYGITDVVPPHHAAQYTRGLLGAASRAAAALERWEAEPHAVPAERAALLDLGCGTAPLLAAAAPRFALAAGVDIAFRWLVVARKRLESAGVRAPVICACAEALPFPPGSFDRVVGESVLETVRDQERTMAEVHRVMRPGAAAAFALPNRFSLGPDPHTGIPAGGWLPKPVVDALARRQGAIPPKRRLLDAVSARRLMARAGLTRARLALPDIPAGARAHLPRLLNAAVDAYHLAKRLPVARHLLYLVGPVLYVSAQKPGLGTGDSGLGRPSTGRDDLPFPRSTQSPIPNPQSR